MIKLCIDPGHGGKDPGTSTAGILEKDINLKISLYMAQRAKQLGFNVTLTRERDIYLTPEQRTDIIKQSGAKLCISNHINAGGGTGAEVIHSLHSDGKLANAILQCIKNKGMPVRRIYYKESKSQKGKDYYFMHRLTYPMVPETLIVEYGFIDNASDRAKLINPDMQKQLVEAVLRAVCNHVGISYSPLKEAKQVNWKEQIMQEAVAAGLIEKGKHLPDEKADKWFVLAVVMNAMKRMKEC